MLNTVFRAPCSTLPYSRNVSSHAPQARPMSPMSYLRAISPSIPISIPSGVASPQQPDAALHFLTACKHYEAGRARELAALLATNVLNINAPSSFWDGMTLLSKAATDGNVVFLKLLLKVNTKHMYR